jgi:hypothetical protein
VATPSSNCTSSKVIPARTWRAISRSDTRRHTQTIMAGAAVWLAGDRGLDYKYESLAFAITIDALERRRTPSAPTSARRALGWAPKKKGPEAPLGVNDRSHSTSPICDCK